MNFKDKVVVVTGAGGGIGKELTLALLEKGAKVAAVDVRDEYLKQLAEYVGEKKKNLSQHVVDITDQKAVAALPAEVVKAQGTVDALINNAGIIQPFVKVNDLDLPTIERVMNINFFGSLYMVKAFLPELLKRPEGYVANVSSMGGFLPVPGQSVYGASKAAIKLMTEGLYAELKDTNVHVSVIFPGAIETHITENSGVAAPKMAAESDKQQNYSMTSPKVAAQVIVSGLEKEKPQIFIGKDSKMMNALYRLSPIFATNLIAKQMKSLLK